MSRRPLRSGADWARAEHRHHRRLRSQGGSDDLTIDVCHSCHSRIHAHPAWSKAHGFLLSAYATSSGEGE